MHVNGCCMHEQIYIIFILLPQQQQLVRLEQTVCGILCISND
jgi:hypothetical protein